MMYTESPKSAIGHIHPSVHLCQTVAEESDPELQAFDKRRITFESRRPITLTPRESEILEMLAGGMKNKEIAGQLRLASGTVRNSLTRIYRLLQVRTRTEAVL